MTADHLAQLMIVEIEKDIVSGALPPNVRNFSELHDHVDANLYGGTEQLIDEVGLDAAVGLCNAAQDLVNEWLRQRGG